MATGTWEDFTDKYGFEDGATTDQIDFLARSHIVEALNTHPDMLAAKVTAVEWDRPGMHNGCFILLFKNPDSLQAAELLKRWLDAPGHTGNDLEAPLPDNIEISEIISEAYAEAQEDNGPETPPLSSRELATVLAALRLWQQEDPVLGGFVVGHDQLQAIKDIATDNGEFEPLTPTEIDTLCERLNVAETPNTEPATRKPYVIVTVSGGVAELAKGGESADVDIIDFDNIKEDYQRAAQELSAPELDYLREHDSYTYDKLKPYLEPQP